MPKFKTCEGCGNEFPTTVLRYNKDADGVWRYKCTGCRKADKEAAQRATSS